ncbi:Ig-like domain-containing protein [Edaphobacter sp. 4G125]|nr:Ig-like domain-containing protein [Edaphobacter sp. 4G125]
MLSRRVLFRFFPVCIAVILTASVLLAEQSPERHGRKYKPPPETSKITVEVKKKFNGKPIMNAAVIFNPFKDGKDIGNLEVKTDPDGKATIDIIPTGSLVRVQVIANGYATFAKDYQVDDTAYNIEIEMLRPREQVSSYVDNDGKASSRKWGVQEPVRPKASGQKPDSSAPQPSKPDSTPPSNSSSGGSAQQPAPQQ